ncbi:histidine kinase [Fulvivirgaceae bacterium BMA12]|uniref:Histidine kinase n=1 Tax=Agaribacillus aureus TaxID=3051825 RepID=A0ABT8L3Z7_9BACT|nr:histidine kinase [Fulvivirgaceae bacterium BMA12]
MANALKKYSGRLGIAILIHLFFKITSSRTPEEMTTYDLPAKVMFILTIAVVLIAWEVCDLIANYFVKKYPIEIVSKKRLVQLFTTIIVFTFPLIILYIYFENYYIKVWLECIEEGNMINEFWSETVRAFLITGMIIGFKVFGLYINHSSQVERDKAQMQKELLRSKYESLKSQLNPHFLFNSYSVLSTLIHKDPDLASDFLNKLSRMYRYILDNKENAMVSLSKEFEFLESYLFLLKTRHEEGIAIENNVELDTSRFFVPTLALQMLIENAIKHNTFSVDQPLLIKIYNEGEDYLVVRNEIRKKGGTVSSTKIGLENICKRYNIHSEKQVVVKSNDNFFTVKLPILPSLNAI